MAEPDQSETSKSREAARTFKCDEDEARLDAPLRKVAKQKPMDDGSPEEKAVRDQQPQ